MVTPVTECATTSIKRVSAETSNAFAIFIAIANALDVSADTLLIDVVTHSVTGVTNELSEMIEKLPKEKQQRIINAVRALVE